MDGVKMFEDASDKKDDKLKGPLIDRLKTKKWNHRKEAFIDLVNLFKNGDAEVFKKYAELMEVYMKES